MMCGDLRIPEELVRLISEGRWPGTREAGLVQNGRPGVFRIERIKELAQEEDALYLYAPPFCRVADEDVVSAQFWTLPGSAPEGIVRERTVMIGDFGMGSDSPLALDYRVSVTAPRVIRLKWAWDEARWVVRPEANEWVVCAESFGEFVKTIGIDELAVGTFERG